MKTYIVYVNGGKVAVIRAAKYGKAQPGKPAPIVIVAYTEL